ncbi:MAG: ATP synthase F1 subunit delta [Clostridia bacterium]|nr:ATP synthase F1 subunit delta [Clostridia bacterium]
MKEMSKEYALAIFTLGTETSREDVIQDSLQIVLSVFRGQPEYQEFLMCPGVPLDARLAGIREAFSPVACEEVVSFLELLCRRGRLALLETCVTQYQEMLQTLRNKKVVKVTSAVPLTAEEQTRLQTKLEQNGQQVILSCSVDAGLIGGMIVEMDGGIIDGSLKSRLKQVKEVVSQ